MKRLTALMESLMKICVLLFLVSGAALADDNAMRTCRTMTDTASRLACYDRIELAPALAVAAPMPSPEQAFGLPRPQALVQPPAPKKIDAIESTITGTFDGWGPNTRFKLANGQTWQVSDGSEAVLRPVTDQKVTIRRNFIGTIFLEIDGTNQAAKVKRVE